MTLLLLSSETRTHDLLKSYYKAVSITIAPCSHKCFCCMLQYLLPHELINSVTRLGENSLFGKTFTSNLYKYMQINFSYLFITPSMILDYILIPCRLSRAKKWAIFETSWSLKNNYGHSVDQRRRDCYPNKFSSPIHQN
jgi:hypothetical protein